MLSFLKTFKQVDTNKYTTQIRNTTIKFTLNSAISMKDNTFRIDNKNIGGHLYGVDWKTVEEVINITDPVK
jgi:hypothetical protein